MIQIIHADVIEGLRQIPGQTVQCVVTSPPYWGLRDYGVDGQIGLEKTPEEFIQKMVEVFREVKRVLRDDGTVWMNLGDSYCGYKGDNYCKNPETSNLQSNNHIPVANEIATPHTSGVKAKDMVGIPWRVAFALQADGWYLRSDIIWSKPNPMPESVTDRPTKSHEYVFLLTKKARYYYDADAVREPHAEATFKRAKSINSAENRKDRGEAKWQGGLTPSQQDRYYSKLESSAGRNRRTVWEIATQPFAAAHFATFPEALVEPCIKAGTSERGCCSVCGAPFKRDVYRSYPETRNTKTNGPIGEHGFLGNKRRDEPIKIQTTGWQPSCTCSADTIPCTVLDPFGGSGTVAKVARDLNRKAILIELNAEYIKIAKERLRLNEQLGAFA
ncbi:MAG: putative methyltransferase [Bacteroidetes bacterium ADurb.BinA104]|nr:MAG: putative methyltransferase [Bacteroidetes bacterium ADurb.BinA104]